MSYLSEPYDVFPDAEQKALARQARAGDKEARDLLIVHNLRLVARWVRPYQELDIAEDLFSEGTLGLMHAIDKYDPDLEYTFSTYASYWIRQYIQRALMSLVTPLYLSMRTREDVKAVKKLVNKGVTKAEHIAACSKVPLPRVQYALEYASLSYVSLDRKMDDADGSSPDLSSLIPEEHDVFGSVENQEAITRLMMTLSRTERSVIDLLFGLNGNRPLTLKEIAARRKTTYQAVSFISNRALAKMRRVLETENV